MNTTSFSFLVLLFTGLAACGGRADVIPSSGDPAGSGKGAAGTSTSTEGNSPSNGGGSSSVTCDGIPECDPNDMKVASQSECLGDKCYSRSACGTTIWCTNQVTTCAGRPTCPADTIEVSSCPADKQCQTVSVCGATAICAPDGRCDGVPACPDGSTLVNQCPDKASCEVYTACGVTITCEKN